ncbi:MAG: prepilin-type N-terminal cleavage/methylation domain-containing protein [Gammaproteobacteria bacterium]|nr:prepilin-type N-terminal cleavage/methylation domain-containing protein [Gammaproteobacteria bacterium]
MTRHKHSGFTILELLITILISALLLLAAIPSWKHLIHKNTALTIVANCVHNLKYARTKAILLDRKVRFDLQHATISVSQTGKLLRKITTSGLSAKNYVEFTPLGGVTRATTIYYNANGFIQKIIINLNGRIRVE